MPYRPISTHVTSPTSQHSVIQCPIIRGSRGGGLWLGNKKPREGAVREYELRGGVGYGNNFVDQPGESGEAKDVLGIFSLREFREGGTRFLKKEKGGGGS